MAAGLLVGLTGGIGSGKSAVAGLLARLGAVVIDSDVLAREVVAATTPGLAEVVARFGDRVLTAEGDLDRAALGRVVFADPGARSDLEAIIHPRVRARAAELAAAVPSGSVVVQVIPLLVETGQAEAFDEVVVVDLDPAVQAARVRSRDGLSAGEVAARVRAQAGRAERLAAADVVIDNNGSPEDLDRQVERLWEGWKARAGRA